ncbi:VOC family protein [Nocardia terpenica]|uniref:Hydroxylase n=1 Tax=Nocardia terpenica TaxID=455432 RepID=A0A164P5H3_9NOCA|nr:VOC family protein [Nocardia terpenica]KZM75148.1 hydroxylase [Nocardia terpenica]NQE93636.1 VOC family protein [Nocardia terpenica]
MNALTPGQIVWFEISTRDAEPAQTFYSRLLGWTYELDPDSSIDGRRYIRIIASNAPFPMGALFETPAATEQINVSILSTDVAADVTRLTKLGATVMIPATQVGDVTWFAVLADPQGNPFSLFSRSTSERFEERMEAGEDYMVQAAAKPARGSMAWFEVGTTDPKATQSFYTQAFGWRFEFDDTAGGKQYYNIFTGNEWPSGGMYDLGPNGADYLVPSFLVGDVPEVSELAENLGAVVEFGPDTNPDGLVYARIVDPTGNRFEVFSNPGM